MVKNLPSSARDAGSIPGQGTKIPYVHAKLPQSCPTLCDPMDHSLPGSCVHEILQTRIVKCIAVPSSSGSSQPKHRNHISYISCIGRQVLYY